MAEYYFESGQGEKALPYYQKALAAAPQQSSNVIKLAYANCLSAIGQIDEAEAIYSELASDPALRRKVLKNLALLRKVDQKSAIAVQIREELAATEMGKKDRSSLLLTLGRFFENGREYDEAFHNFQASRELLTNKHDILQFRAEVDDWINVITPDAITKFHGFGDTSPKPIFVVGMPRSGTTLTEQIIAAHSRAEGIGEVKRISRLATNICGSKGAQGILAKMAEVGPANWKGVPQQYLNLINVLAPGARHAVDKMLHNFRQIGFIHFCFPKAKIIHCKRNPLDNFISAFQHQMISSHGYAYDQIDYGEYYVEYVRLMNHWKSIFPESIYDSSYEMSTADPETAVHNVLKFLELSWEEACLKFNEREATVKSLSSQQVRKPINTESIARWHNYEKHLAPIIAVLEQARIEF